MVSKIIPVQWPIRTIPKFANLAVANTPVKIMNVNPARTFFCLSNDQVAYTLVANVITYTLFDPLYFSFGQPVAGGTNGTGFMGNFLAPGVFEPSLFGGVSQQEIWVWSPITLGPWVICGYEGINDPDFDPAKLTG
jgi:hypothetical protein